MNNRHEQLEAEAVAFHRENPEVWRLFVHFTLDRIRHGFKHYSAYAIMERVRWETDAGDDSGFKVNNNIRPFYARWFMTTYPAHKGFFRTRHQTSREAPPCSLPPLGPNDYPKDVLSNV
jgi:hypothetical protein